MAAFDPSKDKVLKSWRSEDSGLVISINQYNEGQPKVQIGPRIILRKDGKETQVRAGRLSMEDLMWFYEIIDEVRDALADLTKPF
jgi:DNA repair exonuclease SbcCD nuclease subunit